MILSLTPDGTLPEPPKLAGVASCGKLQTSDFETSNIEYIEFWLMDPFVKDSTAFRR
ncbi:MAG: hypothetical protein MZV63_13165 [Marinilabiliales bacterium]|nr:hypothetical protein [Marinilabiliales bacterium]